MAALGFGKAWLVAMGAAWFASIAAYVMLIADALMRGPAKWTPKHLLMMLGLNLIVVPMAILQSSMRRRKLRFVESLKAQRYMVCITCGYDLVGLGDRGRCPECGRRYDARRLESAWSYWGLDDRMNLYVAMIAALCSA